MNEGVSLHGLENTTQVQAHSKSGFSNLSFQSSTAYRHPPFQVAVQVFDSAARHVPPPLNRNTAAQTVHSRLVFTPLSDEGHRLLADLCASLDVSDPPQASLEGALLSRRRSYPRPPACRVHSSLRHRIIPCEQCVGVNTRNNEGDNKQRATDRKQP
jgi:hypothetical protein